MAPVDNIQDAGKARHAALEMKEERTDPFRKKSLKGIGSYCRIRKMAKRQELVKGHIQDILIDAKHSFSIGIMAYNRDSRIRSVSNIKLN